MGSMAQSMRDRHEGRGHHAKLEKKSKKKTRFRCTLHAPRQREDNVTSRCRTCRYGRLHSRLAEQDRCSQPVRALLGPQRRCGHTNFAHHVVTSTTGNLAGQTLTKFGRKMIPIVHVRAYMSPSNTLVFICRATHALSAVEEIGRHQQVQTNLRRNGELWDLRRRVLMLDLVHIPVHRTMSTHQKQPQQP